MDEIKIKKRRQPGKEGKKQKLLVYILNNHIEDLKNLLSTDIFDEKEWTKLLSKTGNNTWTGKQQNNFLKFLVNLLKVDLVSIDCDGYEDETSKKILFQDIIWKLLDEKMMKEIKNNDE